MRTKEYYEAQIYKLTEKDPVVNKKIINKLKRRLKRLGVEESNKNV